MDLSGFCDVKWFRWPLTVWTPSCASWPMITGVPADSHRYRMHIPQFWTHNCLVKSCKNSMFWWLNNPKASYLMVRSCHICCFSLQIQFLPVKIPILFVNIHNSAGLNTQCQLLKPCLQLGCTVERRNFKKRTIVVEFYGAKNPYKSQLMEVVFQWFNSCTDQ